MSVSVTVRPGDSYSSPSWISSKYRRSSAIRRARISCGRTELPADERGAGGERPELPARDLSRERHHPAVRARVEALGRDDGKRLPDRRRHLGGRLHRIGRHVDGADQDVLAAEEPEQLERHPRVRALERDLVDPARGEQRERLLVLPPLAPER